MKCCMVSILSFISIWDTRRKRRIKTLKDTSLCVDQTSFDHLMMVMKNFILRFQAELPVGLEY